MSSYTILVVDDEPDIVDLLHETFAEAGYSVQTAHSAPEALALLEHQAPDVIVSDNRMPGMSGIEFFEVVRQRHQDVIRILMTGYADLKIAIEAINRGWVYKFITKPFKMEEILVAVRRALEYYDMVHQKQVLEQQVRQQNAILEQRVQERTRALQTVTEELALKNSKLLRQKNEIRRLFSSLQRSYLGTIAVMYFALESKDRYTRGHSERVFHYALHVGHKLGLPPSDMVHLKYAALLHDLGKISVPDSILLKPSQLTPEEYNVIKGHPVVGATILDPILFLQRTRDVIRQHHERFDGSGYPDGLHSELIDIKGRIIAVVDAYDAMRSDRPYRMARSRDLALEELNALKGRQFCPRCVTAFEEVLEELGDFYDDPGLLDQYRDELRFMEEDMRGINEIFTLNAVEGVVA
ncbi:MAG: response regulator [Candidatus Zixiibacteriota bacterium]|nr:MAG: response regulator [candidate division Zixibacteria bacterium]